MQALAPIVERIAALPPPRAVVAVDGVDGAGKTMFAERLAASVARLGRSVVHASIDGFHNPRAVRYRLGRNSPEGFFRDSYDYECLERQLIEPFRAGAAKVRTACFDHRRDRPVSAFADAAAISVLLIDGIFLHRDELADAWDFSIFLDVPFETTFARMAGRDGCDPDPEAPANRRYFEDQRIYLRSCQPRDRADAVIDNADFEALRMLRQDRPGNPATDPELRQTGRR